MKTLNLSHALRGKACSRSRTLNRLALWMLALAVPMVAQIEQPVSLPLPNAPSVIQNAAVDHSLTFRERVTAYRKAVINPGILIWPAIGGGILQARDYPKEWGQGAEGYGRRFGSTLGQRVISQTIRFGVAAVDGEDPRYFRSSDRSAWGRVRHAVASSFVSYTASGRRIPAFSRFAGAYGSSFRANTWYPASVADTSHALQRGSIRLGLGAGLNLLHEFAPRFMARIDGR